MEKIILIKYGELTTKKANRNLFINTLANNIRESLKDYEIVGPINIHEFTEHGIKTKREHDYAWYMGEDIKELLRADAIFMSTGWQKSEGCRCELETAKIYNKQIIYQHNYSD